MRASRTRGLTLVELAVVIALLVTLATLAVPSVADHLARHRLKAAGQALVDEMSEARWNAAQRGQPVHINFATGPAWCWSLAAKPGCDCRVPQSCRQKAVGPAQWKGVELLNAEDAIFEPEGTGRGHAELGSTRGQRLRVQVSALGRARLCSPQGATAGLAAC
jgi:type IV fimbrial biogenesis protein FimT